MNERVRQAIEMGILHLNDNDIARGWHFCPDWDDMVIGPGMPELEACTCNIAALLTGDTGREMAGE